MNRPIYAWAGLALALAATPAKAQDIARGRVGTLTCSMSNTTKLHLCFHAAWSPKSTRSRTSFSECATSSTARMVPTRTSILSRSEVKMRGLMGRRIHVPLFAEARSIASNSVSLKRQPSASRLALA